MRNLDRLPSKQARTACSLTFLLECRDQNVIPTGLQLKDPCKTQRTARLIRKTEESLLRNQISYLRYKKETLKAEIRELVTFLRIRLQSGHWIKLDGSVGR